MANVLSMDLRVRFKKLMDQGLCAAAAGKVLLVSPATAAVGARRFAMALLSNRARRVRGKEVVGLRPSCRSSWN